ncbi:MAG: MMPL family transporter [Methylacidiphilales bacterium]|nr:MMPL family transporter [Candidatus Methylacidiphilales bacterium]
MTGCSWFRWVSYLAGLLLLIVILGGVASRSSFSNYHWLEENHPIQKQQDWVDSRFNGGEVLLIALETPKGLFNPATIKTLSQALDLLQQSLPKATITSALSISFVYTAQNGEVSFLTYREGLERGLISVEEFKSLLTASPYQGQLVSDHGNSILVSLQHNVEGDAVMRAHSINIVTEIFSSSQEFERLQFAGSMALNHSLDQSSINNMITLTPILFFIVLLLLLGCYRRIQEPLIISINSIIASLTSLFFHTLFGYPITVISLSLPVIMIVIATADSKFILNHWVNLAALSPKQRAINCFRSLWLPVFYVSVTTAIGFGSFAASEILPLHQLGVLSFCTIIVASFLIVIHTLVAAWVMELSAIAGTANTQQSANIITRTLMYQKSILFISTLLVLLAFYGFRYYQTETNFLKVFFKPSTELSQAFAFVDQNLIGSGQLQVIVKQETGSFSTAEKFAQLRRLRDEIERIPEVRSVNSMVEVVEIVHHSLSQGKALYPTTDQSLAQDILLIELSRSEFQEDPLKPYVDFDYATARLNIHTKNLNSEQMRKLILSIQNVSEQIFPQVIFSGSNYLVFRLSEMVVDSQAQSIIITSLINLVIFFFHFSFYQALVGSIATLFPSLMVIGLISWLRIPFDFSTVMVGSISAGLVVDMVIHFMFYRQSQGLSIPQTISILSRPIIWTTTLLIAGFGVFMLSDLVVLNRFGLFNTFALLCSLFATLVLLPSLLIVKHLK